LGARYYALSRVSFGRIAGSHPRRAGQARWTLPPLPSPLASAATLPACAASPFARVACLSLRSSPVWLASLTWTACTASTLACAALLFARVACLSHLAGVGHCSLAIGQFGHGRSVGLLARVLDRRSVSPLPSTSACSGAGSGWHGCEWIAVGAVYSEGLAPWRRPLLLRVQLGRHRCGGSPGSCGFASLGDTGLSAACQPAGITADAFLVKLAFSPNRVPWGPGQVGSKFKPGAVMGGQGLAHPSQPATGQLTRGRRRVVGCVTIPRHRLRSHGLLGTWTRTRASASRGPRSYHGSCLPRSRS
jgi:hypothetical protein